MQTAATMRQRLFTMRMSEEEYARATLVAQHYGLPLAATVRMLLKREADAVSPQPAPSKKKPTKGTKR
jgi:hypothetical protein